MFHKAICIPLLLSLLIASVANAEAKQVLLPPITVLSKVKANGIAFKASGRKKPLVLRSEKDAAVYFNAASLAKLMKEVNFKKQIVLVFAWRGSGQDRIEHAVLESFPEQIRFTYKPGRTRDLRAHQLICVLRSNVKWRVAGAKKK